MWRAPVLEQEYALPGSKLHFAVDNRDCFAGARQYHADMRWHVIAAFRTVRKVMSIFRHQTIEKFLQIVSRRWVGIFHNDQTAAGVLNKHSHCAISHSTAIDFRLHLISHFVQALSACANVNQIVMNVHWSAD